MEEELKLTQDEIRQLKTLLQNDYIKTMLGIEVMKENKANQSNSNKD